MAWIKFEITDGKRMTKESQGLESLSPDKYRELIEEAQSDLDCMLDAFNEETEE